MAADGWSLQNTFFWIDKSNIYKMAPCLFLLKDDVKQTPAFQGIIMCNYPKRLQQIQFVSHI